MALPTIQPLFSRWSAPDERGTLIGLAFAGFTLGSSITFPLSGFLCQYGFAGGWPSIFYLSGINLKKKFLQYKIELHWVVKRVIWCCLGRAGHFPHSRLARHSSPHLHR